MRRSREKKEFYDYKRFAIRAAKDLMYPEKVVEDIKESKTSADVARIMVTVRNGKERHVWYD